MMEQAEEGNEEEDDSEDPDSEASEKLIEYAGDVLPALGCAMTPSEFAPYFAGLLPSILQRTVSIQILYSTWSFILVILFWILYYRKNIAPLRKNHLALVYWPSAWNHLMVFWNHLSRICTRRSQL